MKHDNVKVVLLMFLLAVFFAVSLYIIVQVGSNDIIRIVL